MPAPRLCENWQAELMSLAEGWDSYDAKPVSSLAIQAVGEISVVPCSDGGIQLEIHRDGFDIEIEFGPNGSIRCAGIGHEVRDVR